MHTHSGSRPQKRRPGGVETLRAIPWVFSWTQTRLHLSAWLGVGEAIDAVLADQQAGPDLAAMYKQWPFFNTNLDLVDMILAKADVEIAGACLSEWVPACLCVSVPGTADQRTFSSLPTTSCLMTRAFFLHSTHDERHMTENYDRLLVTDPEQQALGKELRARLKETTTAVLRLSGNEKLQQHNTVRACMYACRRPLGCVHLMLTVVWSFAHPTSIHSSIVRFCNGPWCCETRTWTRSTCCRRTCSRSCAARSSSPRRRSSGCRTPWS